MTSRAPLLTPDAHAALFLARLEFAALVGGRPSGYESEARWNRMNEAADVRRKRHFFVEHGVEREVVPGGTGAEHCGEFSYRRWPNRVLSCLRRAAAARGDVWACFHACFFEENRPASWWARVGWIDMDVDAHRHELERWLVAEDLGWAATIDEYGVLRVFGDRSFVASFATLYDGGASSAETTSPRAI